MRQSTFYVLGPDYIQPNSCLITHQSSRSPALELQIVKRYNRRPCLKFYTINTFFFHRWQTLSLLHISQNIFNLVVHLIFTKKRFLHYVYSKFKIFSIVMPKLGITLFLRGTHHIITQFVGQSQASIPCLQAVWLILRSTRELARRKIDLKLLYMFLST